MRLFIGLFLLSVLSFVWDMPVNPPTDLPAPIKEVLLVVIDASKLPHSALPSCGEVCPCGCHDGLPCACVSHSDQDAPKKEPPVAQIAGECNFGVIAQDGNKITIFGENWRVEQGEIRKDGKLLLLWVNNNSGALYPGLYTINADGSINGHYGRGEDVTTDAEGVLQGLSSSEVLRNAPKFD